MKHSTILDILLNIFAPMLLGAMIYLLKENRTIPALVSNHLPDGLWAYALVSSILVIWNRRVHWGWIAVTAISAACFEYLQYRRLLPGTGDYYDLTSYILFIIIALLLNPFFKRKFKARTHENVST